MAELTEANDRMVKTSSDLQNALFEQIITLSYNDKIALLERIIKTLELSKITDNGNSQDVFEGAFGLWKSRDISLESIRKKAWGRVR